MAGQSETKSAPTPAQALAKLKDGNQAYVKGESGGQVDDAARRKETSKSQHPFAILLGCSDSRVPLERLFGVGLGDIFVIRNAGNCVDTAALGSIQYAVAVLGAPLVVVMGHERCGAVQAAVNVVEKNATFPGAIGHMIEPILPAVLEVHKDKTKPVDLDLAVIENARRTAASLRADPILSQKLSSNQLDVVYARYDLDSGTVRFFEESAAVS